MDDQRTANVQLTADVQQYSQGIQQANKDTNVLLASVNKLSKSLDGITGRVGKKLMLFSAADLAMLGAAVAVTSKYESQLRTLRAQTVDNQKAMVQFAAGIKDVSKQIPISRGEITELTTQISKLGVTSATEIPKMAAVFERMAAATGEGVGELTSGLIELSRMMGTLANGAAGIEHFSDTIVALSNSMGVSSTAMLSFAQNIAPIGSVAGLTEKQVLALSAAFVKAGADGVAGANAFNSILTNITNLTLTGSPELLKYANAANMSLDAFKNLSPLEQFVTLMEQTSKEGQRGIQMLDSLGINGIRTIKSVTALTREYGSLKKALQISEDPNNAGLTQRASDAAWNDMESSLKRTQQTLAGMTDAMGSSVYPVAKQLLDVFNQMLSITSRLAEPFLKLAGLVSGVAAAFAGIAGGMLSAMGPLSTLMIAMTLFRLSPMRAGFGGFSEGMNRARAGIGPAPAPITEAGRRAAAGTLQPYQAAVYRFGERAGATIGQYAPAGAATGLRAAGYGLFRTVQGFSDAQRTWIANAGMNDYYNRVSVLSPSASTLGSATTGVMNTGTGSAMRALWAGMRTDPRQFFSSMFATNGQGGMGAVTGQTLGQMSKNVAATSAAYAQHAVAVAAARGSTAALAAAAGGAARSLALIPISYARMTASLAMQGAGNIVAAPFRMIGGLFGGGGILGGAIAAVAASAYMIKQSLDSSKGTYDGTNNLAKYNAALGISTEPLNAFTSAVKNATANIHDVAGAFKYAAQASNVGMKYTDEMVKKLPATMDAMVSYLKSLGPIGKDQALLAGQDIALRLAGTGLSAQAVFDQYQKETNGGTQWSSTGSGLANQYQDTLTQNRGWFQGIFNVTPDEANDVLARATAAAVAEGQSYGTANVTNELLSQSNIKGLKVGENGLPLSDIVSATRTTQNLQDLIGNPNVPARAIKAMVENVAKQLEIDPAKLGIGETQWGQVSDTSDIIRMASQENNPDAKKFVDYMNNAIVPGSLPRLIAAATNGAGSMDATGLRETELGKFALSNKNYQSAAATTGSATGDPVIIFRAVQDIGARLDKTAKNLADAVRMTTEAKNQFSPDQRGFQVFEAAQQAYTKKELFNTQATQGAQAAVREEVGGLVASITGATTADQSENKSRLLELDQNTRNSAGEYLSFVRNFYRQLQYATQDHARQIARASEDAAKAMFNPYERMAAKSTASLDTMLGNVNEQMVAIKEGQQAVDSMKKMGISQQFIDLNNLANPEMAQQAIRTLTDLQNNPNMVNEANKMAQRQGDLGRKVTTDYDNVGFRRNEEDFKRAQDRNLKSLRRYGEEVMGDTKKVLETTQGYLKDMGLKTTTYFKNLKETADAILTANERTDSGNRRSVRGGVTKDSAGFQPSTMPSWTPGDNEKTRVLDPNTGEYVTYKSTKTPDGRNVWRQTSDQTPFNASKTGSYAPQHYVEKDGDYWYFTTTKGKEIPLSPGISKEEWDALPKEKKDMWWRNNVVEPGYGAFLGGIVKGGTKINVGEYSRDEMIVPLFGTGYNGHVARMAGAITQEMLRSLHTAGYGSRPSTPAYAGGGVTYHNGTYINGPITVQAQDPNEMARKMREKARLANLAKGANASIS